MEKVFKSRGSDYVPWDKKAPSDNVDVVIEIDVNMEMTDTKDYWRAVIYVRYYYSPNQEQVFAGYIARAHQDEYEGSKEEFDNIFMWRDSIGESVSEAITNFENGGLLRLMRKATEK
jgi:ABC-type sulfate transport system substrate-binding protein